MVDRLLISSSSWSLFSRVQSCKAVHPVNYKTIESPTGMRQGSLERGHGCVTILFSA
jgi:hypothetical protein